MNMLYYRWPLFFDYTFIEIPGKKEQKGHKNGIHDTAVAAPDISLDGSNYCNDG